MGPTPDRRPSKSKFVRSLSLKNLRKSESSSSSSSDGSCVVVVVGSTGTGKSSTISLYTGCEVRTGSGTESVTEQCTLWQGNSSNTNRDDLVYECLHYCQVLSLSLSSLMMFTGETGPAWVDTRGWEDRSEDNTNTFQVLPVSVLSSPVLTSGLFRKL